MKVIITRHKALIELLKELHLCDGTELVLDHASVNDVKGKDVVGVLPLSLAAEANSITEIPLKLTPELRGKELDLETLRAIAGTPTTYVVKKV